MSGNSLLRTVIERKMGEADKTTIDELRLDAKAQV